MENTFNCPVCNKNNWHDSIKYNFEKADFSNSFNSPNYGTRYWAKRQHILQNIWLANKNKVQLKSVYCTNCGFMCYTPRPTEEDLTNKYLFLNSFKQTKAPANPTTRSYKINEKRALRIFGLARQNSKTKTLDVLDYGGYNGRLLKYFIKDGCNGYLVDYTEDVIDGVKRIGSTIADISQDFRFDVIICSHVLEHVVDPVGLLKSFKPFLKDDGFIYAEIPLEVWKGIPISNDPVTHINFFTLESLKTAILSSNYMIKRIKSDLQPYGENYKKVAWALISNANQKEAGSVFKPIDTMRLLHPDVILQARRFVEKYVVKTVLKFAIAKESATKTF